MIMLFLIGFFLYYLMLCCSDDFICKFVVCFYNEREKFSDLSMIDLLISLYNCCGLENKFEILLV